MQASVKFAGRRPRSHQSAIAVIDGCSETRIAACSGRVIERPANTSSGEPVIPTSPILLAGQARPW
jgi:hypothetical protein